MFHADRELDERTDGQTDMTKLIVASHNFANVPETLFLCYVAET